VVAVLPFRAPQVRRVWQHLAERKQRLLLVCCMGTPEERSGFLLRGPAGKRGIQSKLPFLEVSRRLAVCAVKGAAFAFTGAKRKPLTEEADG